MTREINTFLWSFEDLAQICGMSVNGIHQAAHRHQFDPLDLKTLFPFVARKGRPAIRKAMIAYGAHEVDENPLVCHRRRRPSRSKK